MGGRAENSLKWALLAAALAVGAYLRFDGLGEPSYWLDEILHQHLTTVAAAKPWWQWLGRLHEEHAGLYYLTQLATRAFGTSEFAGRLAAAVLGLATIAIVFRASDARWSWSGALAALLLAISPLHVYYSREARGYALLMFLTAALIVVLLRARSLTAVALVLLAMVYSSAVASPVVMSSAAICFAIAFIAREQRRWYAIAGIQSIVALLLFRVIYAPRPLHDPTWPSFPTLDLGFATSLARMFSVSALGENIAGRAAAAMFVFAMVGAIALVRSDRRRAIVIVGMAVLPMAITLVALRVFDHFFAVRYVIASLVGYVLLAAIGIAFVAQLARKFAPLLSIAIVCAIAAQGWSAARTEPFRKLDWRGIAASMRPYLRPGDVILAAEPWSEVSLRYYLGEVPNVKLVHMAGIGIAEIMLHESRAAWLVTAGQSGDTSVRTWMCGFPIVLTSELENVRLHYEPSRRDLLERLRLPDLRAMSVALGDRGFRMRIDDDLLLRDGWADAEGADGDRFRWVVGQRATIVVPRIARRDRVIRFDALPVVAQNVRVFLNDHDLGIVAMPHEWRESTVAAPAPFWNAGLNTIAFEFEQAFAPSDRDRRELAAAFRSIAIDDQDFTSTRATHVPSPRIAADAFIDAKTAWRNTKTRFPANTLRREPVQALLGRLGFDPLVAPPSLENLATSVAAGSDCEDDAAFLRRAFALLLERTPNEIEERDLLRRLKQGATREQIALRILRADDFALRYTR